MLNKKIIFNYLPPAIKHSPSIALSILKSFLNQNNYQSNIIYWNLLLDTMLEKEKKTCENDLNKDEISLFPCLIILAEAYNDRVALNTIISTYNKLNINSLIGEDFLHNKDFNYKKIINIKNKILEIISTELDKINLDEVLLWGISGKFFQWISGYILAEEIIKRDPEARIVIGGFGNKEEALEVLKSCKYFSYAIYGEGEYPLLDLCNHIEKNIPSLNEIPRLIYRENKELKISEMPDVKYLDFENYIFPDYSDYYKCIENKNVQKNDTIFLINSIRSCYWKRCKFCNLNSGYKYRERSPESIVKEIEAIVDKYGVVKIDFVDNDIIGKDFNRFERLLNLLIESNLKHDMKYDFWGELIFNKNLNIEIYKKMFLAGFKTIFGGYEAVSDGLLKKMDKYNGFTDNILYLKACNKYDIQIVANIIRNIPDETALEVKESRKNLHYLRFFFRGILTSFSHKHTNFGLYKNAKYNKLLSNEEKQKYKFQDLYYFLPSNFISDPYNLFFSKRKFFNNNDWEIFRQVESYYITHNFNYKIIKNNDVIYYFEYLDKELLATLILDELDFAVLKAANNKVISLEDMYEIILKDNPALTKENIKEILTNLNKHYLIYNNNDYSSIVSIIDTDTIE